MFLKRVLEELEASLVQKKEQKQYYKFFSFMRNDKERVEFLMLPNFFERKKWLQKKGLFPSPPFRKKYLHMVRKGDVSFGMNQKEVQESLGSPYKIGRAGQAFYRNEIWQYMRVRGKSKKWKRRFFQIFFEKGVVVGWEWL